MAQMMADWFAERQFESVRVLKASRFNTRGELAEFLKLENPAGIIGDAQHLDRALILAGKIHPQKSKGLQLIPVPGGALTPRAALLEPIKKRYASLPLWVQDSATFILHKTPVRRIQLSE